MKMVRYKASELPALTAEQKANLQELAMLSDEDIDLSDIPEITKWSGAVRGGLMDKNSNIGAPLVKPSIIARFQDIATQTGRDYQDIINDALEEYLLDH